MPDVLKRVIKLGFNNFKEHWVSSSVLAFIALIFLCSGIIISINNNYSFFSFLFVFFISLPILFAVIISNYGCRKNIDSLRWSNIFRYSLTYFKSPFRGALRIISSILVFLVSSLFLETIFGIIGYSIVCNIFPYFPEVINELYNLIYSSNIEGINQLMITYAKEFNAFEYFSIGPATILSLVITVLFSLYNLYYSYFLINFPLSTLTLTKICFKNARLKARKTMMKGFLSISWMFIILLLLGYFISAFVFYANNFVFSIANVLSITIAVGLSTLYLPFFLSFNEQLFIENIDLYDPNKNDSSHLIINALNEQIKQYGDLVNTLEKNKHDLENQQLKDHQDDKTDDK